jgi:hypothetical protein
MVTIRSDAQFCNRSSISGVAHVVERIGLAIAGALCGLFVTELLAKANIGVLNTVGVDLAMILFGIVGFYMGIDIPIRPSRTPRVDFSSVGLGPNVDVAELLSAVGIFLAAVAALVSVLAVVVDEVLPAIWIVAVGISWLIGVAMQIAAGVFGRVRKCDHVTG